MQYCPQCKGEGGAVINFPNGEIKKITCRLCQGERFVTDKVYDKYRMENHRDTYTSSEEKRKLSDKLARENNKRSIEFDIKSRARDLGKSIR